MPSTHTEPRRRRRRRDRRPRRAQRNRPIAQSPNRALNRLVDRSIDPPRSRRRDDAPRDVRSTTRRHTSSPIVSPRSLASTRAPSRASPAFVGTLSRAPSPTSRGRSSGRSVGRSVVHLVVQSIVHSVVQSIVHSFIRSFIHPFIHSFSRSSIRSFVHALVNGSRSVVVERSHTPRERSPSIGVLKGLGNPVRGHARAVGDDVTARDDGDEDGRGRGRHTRARGESTFARACGRRWW